MLRGKGILLDDPSYPITQPVTVQLSNDTTCWGSEVQRTCNQGTTAVRRRSSKTKETEIRSDCVVRRVHGASITALGGFDHDHAADGLS